MVVHVRSAVPAKYSSTSSQPRDFVEGLNHFIVSLDLNRLPAMATGIVEFRSALFDSGRVVKGAETAERFRKALSTYKSTAKPMRTRIVEANLREKTGFWLIEFGPQARRLMIFAEMGDSNVRRYYDAFAD